MALDPRLFLSGWQRPMLFGVMAVTLAGCSSDSGFSLAKQKDGGERVVSVSDRSVPLIERDVEAPEVFQVTDRGLWDGRPSLGGIWVAHPDVDKPERVIIRNTENSEFIIGALFRRERDNPGPALMVSSDAAAELGMLAGAPAKLDVTALRREETPDPEAAAEAAAAAELAAETEATAAETEATLAALPVAETGSVVAVAPASASGAVATAAAAISAVEAEAADAPVAAVAAPDAPDAEAVVTPVAAVEPEPEVDDSDKKYLQIGIFSQQSHAERTASVMTAAGLEPTVKVQSAEGTTFWRVVIGPADSVFSRTAMLNVARGEGFAEAFPVVD
ncbi:MAG: SPOR domain-containing protein [Pseudomonadota bacterium]